MKRKFTLLIAALALLMMLVQPGKAWGQESYSITYDVTAIGNMFASGSSYESASGYWKVPASAGNSAQINIPITYQPDSDITITFRIATFGSGTNPSASNTTITAIGTETNSNWSGTGVSSYPSSSTYVNGVMTISKPQDPTTLGGLAITMGVNSGIKIFRLQSIAVEYTYSTGGGDLEDNDLTLSPTSLALDIHNNPNTGTVTYTTSSTGAVTVSQSEYVTTSVSGNTITVTPVAVTPSEQTITVSQAADATYAAGSATFTVNVTNSAPTVTVTYHANGGTGDNIEDHPYQGSNYTVAGNTFTYSNHAFTEWNTNADGTGTEYQPGATIENISANIDLYAQWEESSEATATLNIQSYATANNWSNSVQYLTATVDQVTFTAAGGGNTGKYYTNGQDWRFYQNENATLTISVPDGYHLVSITPTYTNTNGGLLLNGSTSVSSNSTVSASGTSVTFSVGNSGSATNGQVRFTNIDVIYASEGGSQSQSDLTITNTSTDLTFDLYPSATTQVINYTTSSTGAITITPETSEYFSYVHDVQNKTITVTPLAVTPSAQTVTISQAADDDYYAGTATFTVSVVSSAPLANIAELTALPAAGSYNVALVDAVVTYVGGSNAYIQDASGAVVMHNSNHGLTVGDVLNGTATVAYQLYNANPQITDLSGVTPVPGTAPDPTEVAQSEWIYTFSDVLSQYFKVTGATITQSGTKYYVSLNNESIQLYKQGGSIGTLDLTKTYSITGFPTLYNSTKELTIYADPEVEASTEPSITIDPETADPFTYVYNSNPALNGPSEEQVFEVTGDNLTSNDIIATITNGAEYFEVTDDEEYNTSVTIASGDIISVRMKAGLTQGSYEGTLTLTNEGAENVEVVLSGSVTGAPHSITSLASHGNITFAPESPVSAGTVVTMTAVAAEGYEFVEDSWVFYDGNLDPVSITVTEGNKFTMPDYDLGVDATFISTSFEGVFEPFTGTIVEGDYVIYGGTNGAMKNTITSNRFDNQSVSFNESNISNPNIAAVWHIAQITGTDYWSIYNYAANKYAGGTTSKNQGALYDNTEYDLARWTITYDSFDGFTFENYGRTQAAQDNNNAYLRQNGGSGWGTYLVSTGNAPQLYKLKQPETPTWDQFPTEANILTGENYELTVSNYVSGYPTPTLAINTEVSSSLYVFENGLFIFSSNATGDYEFTFTAENTVDSASATLIITVSAPAAVNYYYSVNGVKGEAQSTTQGQSVTLADAEDLNEDFVFVGWTANANDVVNILAAGSSQTIDAEITFYAVYSNTVSVTETKVAILDGEAEDLTSTAQELTFSENGFTYYSNSVKYQALGSNPNNNISNGKVLLIGKKNKYLYNTTAFGDGITKFEVYANAGAAAAATAGVYFSTSTIEAYETGENTWESDSEGMGTDNLYDASSYLPSGAKYFWYQVTNDKNTQVQFRITYTETSVVTTKYTLVKEYSGEQEIATVTPTDLITVPSGAVLTITGDCTGTAANLIIEDGGQLIVNNSVAATVEKTIQASGSWGSKDGGVDGWDLISSPIGTVNTASVTNLTPAPVGTALQYDLYSYNEATKTWYNQQGTEHPFTQLMVGEGYLYSRKENAELGFAGEVSSASITKTLTYTEANGTLAGWNLVGNPYTHNITWANLEPTNVVTTGYYTLGYDGQWSADPSTSAVIKPMQGFLVKANASGAKIIFNNTASKSRANDDYIKFIVANSQYEDAAYAMFSENEGLDKINHRNADIPMVYIPQDGQNYAIATMDDNTQAFELNFKAMTTGQYTLSFKAEGKYSYLHVIDRLTGEDIDMLLDGEYSFMASPRDNEARFIVKLDYNANFNDIEVNDSFAYQNGDDIIVSGEGELQIFDIMGRFVARRTINGTESISASQLSKAVYIFRMVGNEVKTQKIVVR